MAGRLATLMSLAALVLARTAAGQNLVVNGDFSDANQLDGWFETGVWSSIDWEQDPSSGSARAAHGGTSAGSSQLIRQCVPVTGGTPYRLEARVAVAEAQEPGAVFLRASWRDLADCYAGGVSSLGLSSTPAAIPTGDFELVGATFIAPAGAASADLQLVVRKDTAVGSLIARFDAVYLPEPIGVGPCIAAAVVLAAVARRRRQSSRSCRTSFGPGRKRPFSAHSTASSIESTSMM